CLGWCLGSFQPTGWDYRQYEMRAYEIFASPRGRAAILCGGLVWRLAMELLGNEGLRQAAQGPSVGIFEHCYKVQPRHGPPYFDDTLTPEEEYIICGTYKAVDRHNRQPNLISWWPRPSQWKSSGLNLGHWTVLAEEWFVGRLRRIRKGEALPLNGKDWKSHIRFHSGGVKLAFAIQEESAHFLSDTLLSTSA
ncbi:hypothetical protein C8Q78DRAFT_979238, partial [Trametes maxima]